MVLLLFSLLFYAWGEPIWICAMIAITLTDYISGLILVRLNGGARKLLMWATVLINLALLFVFKYYNFFAGTLHGVTGLTLREFGYAMPIGISFFTFQSISYVLDVSRGEVRAQKNYFYLLLYISMFPQLIAGPIVRYADIAGQINGRKESVGGFADGAFRFTVGLGKKVLFSNYAGSVAAALLTDGLSSLSASGAWVGILCYAFQIYFDFSGYSDMAIGLGKIFGFDFKENFNYPYISRTVTEFWRRWHISLGSFFRDYVYIPLGGNRRRPYRNLFIVWALTGVWHGASWNFLLWGLFYGMLLFLEKLLLKRNVDMGKIPVISNLYLLIIMLYGWAIFYYTDLTQLGLFTQSLLGLNGAAIRLSLRETSAIYACFFLLPVMAVGATPLPARLGNRIFCKRGGYGFKALWGLALLAASFIMILNQSYNPFLYFRF